MEYESFFAGVGATVLGTLIGVFFAPKLMYPMQKRLLEQQLKFQEKMAELDSEQRQKIAVEQNEISKTIRLVLRDLSNHVASLEHQMFIRDHDSSSR